jgi:DNA-binding MarR family transcriptional regulator
MAAIAKLLPPTSSGPLDPDEAALWEALVSVTRSLFRHLQHDLRRVGVTVPQYWVLQCLDLHGSVSSGQLSQWLEVTLPTVTGITDHLEGLGYVQRTPSKEDRRRVLVRLTPKGSRTLRALYQHQSDIGRDLSGLIGEDVRVEMTRSLIRISARLTPDHGPCRGCTGDHLD